jgi:iron complex outermembrane receptor protein
MEQAENYSLAFFTKLKPFFSISLTGFYNLLTDRITYITGDNGVGQYQNFGEVLYSGFDTALSWKIHPLVNTKTSYTYLEVKDQETGLWIPGHAPHRATLNLYLQPLPPLFLVVTGKYAAKVYRDRRNTRNVPEYALCDLRADYAFKRFSLFGEVKNLFDKTYYYADGLLGPPQTWLIGMNWRL